MSCDIVDILRISVASSWVLSCFDWFLEVLNCSLKFWVFLICFEAFSLVLSNSGRFVKVLRLSLIFGVF